MSPRRWQERIQDILDAIMEIHSFVDKMDFPEFQDDLKTIRAVELNIILIGEAANAVPKDVQDTYPQIPWFLIKGMRNRLVHTYFEVSPQILWDTIQQDLPLMENILAKIIEEDILP